MEICPYEIKNQPILEAEFVKYVSLIVNSGAVPNSSKIKHNGLSN